MSHLLPFTFLIAFASLFGLAWIFVEVDPDSAAWYLKSLVVFLTFVSIFCLLGIFLYFVRIRFYRRYSVRRYIFTSFKMAGFVAFFAALIATLAILKQISTFNVFLAIAATALFALYSYLGKKK